MQTPNRLPLTAAVVAFAIAATVVLAGVIGPIVALPLALIPLCAGIGILRNRVWSAYGYAAILFAQFLLLPLILLRPGLSTARAPQIIGTIIGPLALGVLFMFAGRSLAASGARRGRAWPWVAIAVLSVVPFFFVQTFRIPSGSMQSTLLPGDSILAQVFPVRPPPRGEMILFFSPADRGLILVKRVIAIAGDHLGIAGKAVILNGTALDEKYVTHTGRDDFYPENFPNDVELPNCAEGHEMLSRHVVNGEIVVPAGNYFVLGDNRENSLDSRCWGFVTTRELVGKPLMIYDSTEKASSESPVWQGHRRWERLFKFF
jgi:signal peptidase I